MEQQKINQTQCVPTHNAKAELLDQQFLERKAEFKSVLPNGCSFERFARIVKTATIQNPNLLLADRPSLFMSCFKSAQDGLLPDGRESALVVYSTKQKDGTYKSLVQYMPMISGILKKIRNSGELSSIASHVVYSNDRFDYCLGDNEHITHEPILGERGAPTCVYAIARTKDGAIYREVMSFNEIETIRNLSKAKDGQAWGEHWAEMAKKTVIRRISKRLPMSTDLERIIQREDEAYEFESKCSNSSTAINNHVVNNSAIDNSIDTINQQISALKPDGGLNHANN